MMVQHLTKQTQPNKITVNQSITQNRVKDENDELQFLMCGAAQQEDANKLVASQDLIVPQDLTPIQNNDAGFYLAGGFEEDDQSEIGDENLRYHGVLRMLCSENIIRQTAQLDSKEEGFNKLNQSPYMGEEAFHFGQYLFHTQHGLFFDDDLDLGDGLEPGSYPDYIMQYGLQAEDDCSDSIDEEISRNESIKFKRIQARPRVSSGPRNMLSSLCQNSKSNPFSCQNMKRIT
ncbi:hypothetical protein FGO68_gene16538 [Halteria grandinella]|uniref:Uncharacterized protein n=1 Tax=Halteria grandinella TaxID=5974 RepID=A0A8J8NYS8_HALGN|nr:hypothetical protein FGO68_gene16538 [Halteria grandinella]